MGKQSWATTRSVASPWSKQACFADPRNDCQSGRCTDGSSSDDFLFGLWMPGGEGPQRFLPSGTETDYRTIVPDCWPWWGSVGNSEGYGRDLSMGTTSSLGGYDSECTQDYTYYPGSPNEVCGGQWNWAPRSSRSGAPPARAAAAMALATRSRGCACARRATSSPTRRRACRTQFDSR